MKAWKKRFTGFLIAACALCIGASLGTVQNVQAASKASYTIKKIQEKKTYKNSSAIYSYELPQLKGNSAAIKKINKSLNNLRIIRRPDFWIKMTRIFSSTRNVRRPIIKTDM